MGSQHAVEDRAILSLIQVRCFHCDHRRTTGLILKHAGVEHALCKAWPVVVDIENCHQDLMCINRQMANEDEFKHRIFMTQ